MSNKPNDGPVMLVPVDDEEVAARIVAAVLDGSSEREIAQRYGLSIREVRRIMVERLANISLEERAIEVGVEVARISEMQQRLYALTLGSDDATVICNCAQVWNRLSERKGALRGHDIAPQRRDDRLTILEAPKASANDRIREVIMGVINDPAHRPASKDGDVLEAEPIERSH